MVAKSNSDAHRGIILPRRALRRLAEAGIYAQASVSLEYQQIAKRYVVRGVESGGAVETMGRYVTFCGDQGEPLAWLQPLDAVGVNGVHALVVAPSLVRVEMFRRGQTYDVLISRFAPASGNDGKRPALVNSTIFHAENGYLPVDLSNRRRDAKQSELPRFLSRAGEPLDVPGQFEGVVKAVAVAVRCFGCSHSHYLRGPEDLGPSPEYIPIAEEGFAAGDHGAPGQ